MRGCECVCDQLQDSKKKKNQESNDLRPAGTYSTRGNRNSEGRKEGRQAGRQREGVKDNEHGTYLIARPFLTVPRVRAPVVSLGHDPVVQECVGGNIKHEKSNSD